MDHISRPNEQDDAAGPSPLLVAGNIVEGGFALLIGAYVLISIPIGFALIFGKLGVAITALVGVLVVWTICIEGPFVLAMLLLVASSASIRQPVMLHMARIQAQKHWLIRPFLALWWFIHFFHTLFASAILALEDVDREFGLAIFMAIFAGGFTRLSFGFGAMAWACVDRNDPRLDLIWRARWYWGAACGFLFLIIDWLVK